MSIPTAVCSERSRTKSTKGLFAEARQGSREALGGLIEDFRDYLTLVADRELAHDLRGKVGISDLVQETFLEAQRDFGQFHGDNRAEFQRWLRRLLCNNLANAARHYRATAKRDIAREVPLDNSHHDLKGFLADRGPSPSGLAIHREQEGDLNRAMARLKEHQRQVIRWRHWEGRSFEEIGALLGCSADAARKLWWRAFERLSRIVVSGT